MAVILGVDASNLRQGGGVTHLRELLRKADPAKHGFERVFIWGGLATLSRLEERSWLRKTHVPMLDHGLLRRSWWQRTRLSHVARGAGCDLLFAPGGSFAGDFRPVVTMSRNMLPVELQELRRYGWSFMTLKLLSLRVVQRRSFQRADGLIFLTRYARDAVMRMIRHTRAEAIIIPHGLDAQFAGGPRPAKPIAEYSSDRPFRIIYVSTIDVYKHQWHVADAVMRLRAEGLPVVLDLVGPAYPRALKRLRCALQRVDPSNVGVRYVGQVPHDNLPAYYAQADLCIYASSCENMPNILLEGMASGLPVACSNCGPMPEILGDAGSYFDPEDAVDIARAVRALIDSPELRSKLAGSSFERAQRYSWSTCADLTFDFLAATARRDYRRSKK